MGLFKFNKIGNKGEQTSETTANNPWDSLKQVQFNNRNQISNDYSIDTLAKGAKGDANQQRENMRKLQELQAKMQAIAKPSNSINKGQ